MMRLAVLAAEQAAGAVLDAVAGGVADRRLRRLDDHLELAAGTAAIAPVAAAVGAELVAAEEEREAHLVHLDAAELDAAGRLPLAAAGQPSPADEAPPPGRAWNRCQMNGRVGARIDALDGDAEAPSPAGHRALRAGGRQRPDDRLDDLLAAVVGAQRDRRAGPRPDDRAFLELHVSGRNAPSFFGVSGIDQVGERHDDGGVRVGEGGVDEADDLRVAVGEIDLEVAAALGDAGADVDVA